MSLVDECNAESHTWERSSEKYITGGKEGECVVIDPSPPHLLSSDFFQQVLSGSIASNVKSFEGILLLSYTLSQWEEIFQVLGVEAQQTIMMLSEGISISKGGVVKMTK